MNKATLGIVSEEEKIAIQAIQDRKVALTELAIALKDRNLLQEPESTFQSVLADINKENANIREWWKAVASKYGWNTNNSNKWHLDYKTNTISLEQ